MAPVRVHVKGREFILSETLDREGEVFLIVLGYKTNKLKLYCTVKGKGSSLICKLYLKRVNKNKEVKKYMYCIFSNINSIKMLKSLR